MVNRNSATHIVKEQLSNTYNLRFNVRTFPQIDFYNPRFLERSAIAFDIEGFVEFLSPPDNV